MDEIWVEKYRPRKLADVVGQAAIVERLSAYAKARTLPHLLLAGPAGTGKTTCALALVHELFGEEWKQNFIELNASDERGIDTVRVKIKDFARTAPFGDVGVKVIFLDEADALTSDAQAALRRTMEKYAGTCRFILSCNYSSKIIEPIQSRLAVFRFRPLKKEDVDAQLRKIAKNERITFTKEGMEAVLYVSGGDMRKAINTLQVAASAGDKVDDDAVYRATATARPEEVVEMMKTALQGEFLKARDLLDELLITYGLAGEDVIRQVHRSILDLPVSDDLKVALVDRVGEAEFRLVEGANDRIQLEALLAHFALQGKGHAKK